MATDFTSVYLIFSISTDIFYYKDNHLSTKAIFLEIEYHTIVENERKLL